MIWPIQILANSEFVWISIWPVKNLAILKLANSNLGQFKNRPTQNLANSKFGQSLGFVERIKTGNGKLFSVPNRIYCCRDFASKGHSSNPGELIKSALARWQDRV